MILASNTVFFGKGLMNTEVLEAQFSLPGCCVYLIMYNKTNIGDD